MWNLTYSIILSIILLINGSIPTQKKPGTGTKQIPAKVMNGLMVKFPRPDIDKWTREKESGYVIYDLEFRQGGQKFEADIRENGQIDNWEKAIPPDSLPIIVRKTVEKKYPMSSIEEVMETNLVKDGKDLLDGYEITIKTRTKKIVEVTIAPDGKVIEDSDVAK